MLSPPTAASIRAVTNGAATVTETRPTTARAGRPRSSSASCPISATLKVNGAAVSRLQPGRHELRRRRCRTASSAVPQVTASSGRRHGGRRAGRVGPGPGDHDLDGAGGMIGHVRGQLRAPRRRATSSTRRRARLASGTGSARRRPTGRAWTTNPGSMAISGGRATTATTTTNTAQNLLLQPALGNWSATTKVIFGSKPSVAPSRAGCSPTRTTTTTSSSTWRRPRRPRCSSAPSSRTRSTRTRREQRPRRCRCSRR